MGPPSIAPSGAAAVDRLTVDAVPDTPRVTAVSALQSLLPMLVALSLHAKQATGT